MVCSCFRWLLYLYRYMNNFILWSCSCVCMSVCMFVHNSEICFQIFKVAPGMVLSAKTRGAGVGRGECAENLAYALLASVGLACSQRIMVIDAWRRGQACSWSKITFAATSQIYTRATFVIAVGPICICCVNRTIVCKLQVGLQHPAAWVEMVSFWYYKYMSVISDTSHTVLK